MWDNHFTPVSLRANLSAEGLNAERLAEKSERYVQMDRVSEGTAESEEGTGGVFQGD